MSRDETRQARNARAVVEPWTAEMAARLRSRVKEYGRQEDVAEKAAVSRQRLVGILSGKVSPSEVAFLRICEAVGVTRAEILEGIKIDFGPPNHDRPLAGTVRIGDDEYSVIKRYSVDASAGFGRFPLYEGASGGIAFSRSWLIKRGIAADMAGLISVKGDSMTPTIQDGATVLVHLAEMEVKHSGVYVFNRAGETCVKRIVPATKGADGRPTTLVITSDNNEYPPEVVTGPALNDLRIIGRVRSVMADL